MREPGGGLYGEGGSVLGSVLGSGFGAGAGGAPGAATTPTQGSGGAGIVCPGVVGNG